MVLGCGTIHPRKGVDLFVACAAAVRALRPRLPIRFVWIGLRLPQEIDRGYYSSSPQTNLSIKPKRHGGNSRGGNGFGARVQLL